MSAGAMEIDHMFPIQVFLSQDVSTNSLDATTNFLECACAPFRRIVFKEAFPAPNAFDHNVGAHREGPVSAFADDDQLVGGLIEYRTGTRAAL